MEFNTLSLILCIALVVVGAVCFFIGMTYRKKVAEKEIGSAEEEARRIINESIKGGESKKREMLLEAKEEIHKSRNEYEKEVKERRSELQKQERRLQQKEESLDKKLDLHEKKEDELAKKAANIQAQQEEVASLKRSQMEMLEKISGLTQEEAKAYILKGVEDDVRHETAVKIKEIEQQLKDDADSLAREIITTAIQRCAADHVAEATVSVVPLPNDEMKGRIIGREGRNIRTLETITGVDLIIDDTPEAITVSSFDPVRREIARLALEKLIADGRIHPTRIEDMVEKARREVDHTIKVEGERASFETGVHNLHPETHQAPWPPEIPHILWSERLEPLHRGRPHCRASCQRAGRGRDACQARRSSSRPRQGRRPRDGRQPCPAGRGACKEVQGEPRRHQRHRGAPRRRGAADHHRLSCAGGRRDFRRTPRCAP